MEQSYKEKYEDILARLERAKNDDEVCDERFCCVIDDLIPELAESKNEKIRMEIINYFHCQSEEEPTRKEIHDKWIAWLENIPYTIDHEKRDGFHLGYKACLERQGEQKPEENKVNIGGISSNWSDEDNWYVEDIISLLDFGGSIHTKEQIQDWLRSLQDRVQPQPKQEWKQENTGDLTAFENAMMHIGGSFFGQHAGLDPNDTNSIKEQANLLLELVPSKEWSEEDINMIDWLIRCCKEEHKELCNDKYGHQDIVSDLKRDCRKKWDWLESLKNRVAPQNTWKPSDEQMGCLSDAIEHYNSLGYPASKLKELLDDLKKLKGEV